jgi:TetR/AcrR family transcriptional regulator, regulator of cefoperazone and chloramphenicol sensitivity
MVPDRTRAKLLEAGGEIFAQMGYHAATIREIAQRAGANVAAVNYHFGDKLGLYTEVLRESMQSTTRNEALRAALEYKTAPEEVLREVISALLHTVCAADHRDRRLGLMMHELAQPTPAMPRVIDETMAPIYARLRELIGSIIGLPHDDEKTRLCTHSIVGQIVHYMHARPILMRLWPEFKMAPAQLDRIAQHIADFSLAHLREMRSLREEVVPAGVRRDK